jgi:hypothetical protein
MAIQRKAKTSAWYCRKKNKAEMQANARLMAAAPDLLNALKVILNWCDGQNPNGECLCSIEDIAASAIQLAEGKR